MYCIWLTFDSSNLSKIIIKLAQKYDGPIFQPHCTLVGKTDVSLLRLKSAIINLMSIFKPIEVHPTKIDYSANIWRALYIELEEKRILTKWHKNICDLLSINNRKDFLPHISLMYSTVSQREKEKISHKVQLQSVYKICSIQIVECNEQVDDWKPAFELQI